ncbi:MAG: hypothetical protein J7M06_05060, partial [Proteobacteria bacterium]|nr:hypothetical protein [Pseudomonadota bacterium]
CEVSSAASMEPIIQKVLAKQPPQQKENKQRFRKFSGRTYPKIVKDVGKDFSDSLPRPDEWSNSPFVSCEASGKLCSYPRQTMDFFRMSFASSVFSSFCLD